MTDLSTTVMVPTLWRWQHVQPFMEALHNTQGTIPARALWLVQDGDDRTLTEVEAAGADYMVFPTVEGEAASMVQKCNAAWPTIETPFLFGASDDVRLLPGTLERCHEVLNLGPFHIVCVNDDIPVHIHDGQMTGHCLIRCSYIHEHSGVMDQPNTIMHPGYVHYFSDLELMQVATLRGVYATAWDAKVEHLMPHNGKAPSDATRNWAKARFRADHAVYRSREHMWQKVKV